MLLYIAKGSPTNAPSPSTSSEAITINFLGNIADQAGSNAIIALINANTLAINNASPNSLPYYNGANNVTWLVGLTSYATNYLVSLPSTGWTNTSWNKNAQVSLQGSSLVIVFYFRSGSGGNTVAGIPLHTNTYATIADFGLGNNCGYQVISGSYTYGEAHAE